MPLDHNPLFAALMGGILLSLQAVLMLTVGAHRNRTATGVGVNGDVTLERLVRRHGNLAENAAFFVLVAALYEILFGRTWLLLILGVMFLLARLSHAVAFSSDSGSHLVDARGAGRIYILMRVAGAGFTALSSLVLGLALVVSILLGA